MLTIQMVRAIVDIARYSRDILTTQAADGIAQAFGLTTTSLNLVPTDYGMYMHEEGTKGISTSSLAMALAKHLVPGYEPSKCDYIGSGKTADHYTFDALGAIKEHIDYPSLYVREKLGPDKPTPDGRGHYLGSGETLGFELVSYDEEDNERTVLQMFDTEDAAYETLVHLANEQPEAPDEDPPQFSAQSFYEQNGEWPTPTEVARYSDQAHHNH
jgi:hypothetical protein